ncbi:MAG: winged helix-turn-helix domain-containing protein [Pyrinomonadaceae bacterium]|nr:winged helix-turn-helix domain-containing protein [Pyrinomonadaceae bacterium]
MKELATNTYTFAECELDLTRRLLLRAQRSVPLNAKAFDLLVVLIENRERVIAKEELMELVWRDQFVEEANLAVQISTLRKALGEKKGEHRYIVTVPGRGYRFVAEVQNGRAKPDIVPDIVIETHTTSHVLMEEEVLTEPETKSVIDTDWAAARAIGSGESGLAAYNFDVRPNQAAVVDIAPFRNEAARRPRLRYALAVASLMCLGLAFGIYYLNVTKSAEPFEKIKLTRLTNTGKVSGVAVSPDGKYIAYVLGESEGNSLWMQQVGTANNVRLLPPVKAQVWDLTFTPDGSHIFYSLFAYGNANVEFFRISSLGGISETLPNIKASFIAFAPDGKRIAYVQSDSPAGQNYLVIADADSTNQQTIARKTQPNTFESNAPVVAWSPDAETIACLVNHFEAEASYSSIVGINIRDGSEKLLSEQRWYDVFGIEWLKNGSGLLISASDKLSGGNQIHFLPYPKGAARQITNDLNQYDSLNTTADGESFVSIETNTVNGIYIGEAGADANDFAEILSETGSLHPLVWTPDGKIIYRSNKDGGANLWTMDADGGNRRQLTANAQVDARGLCISPDGKFLVFGSWRNGKSNLWRITADGGNLTQLTNGEVDVYPSCAPDNRTIVYQKGLLTRQMLWTVPLAGGESVQLTEFNAKWCAVSNDGSRISYFFIADDKWRFGIISSADGSILQRLEVPTTLNGPSTHWSPDDQSLLFVSTVGNRGNVWSLPLNGSPAKPITNFASQLLSGFSLSADGKHLAVSRASTTSDAVLISNAR